MLSYLRLTFLIAILAFAAACSPIRTGVTGNTLTSNAAPAVSVTANPPLTMAGHGRLWITPEGDVMGSTALASFDYAIYADTASGPVPRFAYAAIARLTDRDNWHFEPQSWKQAGALSMHRAEIAPVGLAWTAQTLLVPSANDWPSDVWRTNKRDVPETWLVKRWIASLDDDMRLVAEYREALPQCLEAVSPDLVLMSGKESDCLSAFNQRAEKVFSVRPEATDLNAAPAPASNLALPASAPNTANLMGKVQRVDKGDGGSYE